MSADPRPVPSAALRAAVAAAVPATASGTATASVERAVAELRRGAPVAIRADGRGTVAMAAEGLTDARLDRFIRLVGGSPTLVVTARRAFRLGLGGDGEGAVRVAPAGGPSASALLELADPLAGAAIRPTVVAATVARPGDGDSAAVALAKLARLLPAAITAPAGGRGGRELEEWARREDLLLVDAAAITAYPATTATRLVQVGDAAVPLAGAEATRMVAFRPVDGGLEHVAILVGQPDGSAPVLTRLHSECFTGDLLGSLRCDCGDQLRGAVRAIGEAGSGVLLYLAQEGRGIGLVNKLRAYQLQDAGLDTVDANLQLGFDPDERIYLVAAEMLRQLGFTRVRLMTNNPHKVTALGECGIEVVERVPHVFPETEHNARYLRTKAARSGHLF